MEKVKDGGVKLNMSVDYVINFCFANTKKNVAISQFERLLESLANVGLATEVREGDGHALLVFVKVASMDHLYGEVYRSRIRDWIQGIRSSRPEKETKKAVESDPLYEAERLRIIYQLITNSQDDGGAGITPKQGEWNCVDSIFALHDHDYNKEWLKNWSTRWLLTANDLDDIRNRLGEQIAYYFAFTQSYFAFLIFPAAFGFSAWILLGYFSPVYAVVNGLWCIIFTEYWKHQEVDLAVRWGVRGVSKIETQRREFEHEKIITDPVTGEKVKIFSAAKRLQRQLLQIPFALFAVLALGTLIATCFGIEIFISEVYNGPLKTYLVFLPTVILTIFMPIMTGIITNFATRLTDYENYETHGSYNTAMTQKIFVINFITSYLPILLTAFVYVPFGSIIVPYLDIFKVTVKPFCEDEKQMQMPQTFTINPERLRKQVIYFTVTAQLVNLCMEVIVPYIKRRGLSKVKEIQNDYAMKHGGAVPQAGENDAPAEAEFLTRVRKEVELDIYDVTIDLREMILQFGYLSLFSVVWPLAGCSFLVNNWLELRADLLKICVEMRRPTPWRADTIGPWLDSLSFLTWLGSITTAALVYMFNSQGGVGPDGSPQAIKAWALLLTVFFSEHIFFIVRWAVQVVLKKAVASPGLTKERRERYVVRQKYFEENLSELEKKTTLVKDELPVKFDRETLEEEVRKGSQSGIGSEVKFWARQRGWREAAAFGAGFIERWGFDGETKKDQ